MLLLVSPIFKQTNASHWILTLSSSLPVLISFYFYLHLRVIWSTSIESLIETDKNSIKPVISLGRTGMFIMLSLSIHEYGKSSLHYLKKKKLFLPQFCRFQQTVLCWTLTIPTLLRVLWQMDAEFYQLFLLPDRIWWLSLLCAVECVLYQQTVNIEPMMR